MKIIHDIDSLETIGKEKFGIAIGNFDGFHVGHQEIISKMLDFCNDRNISLIIMTFVPHPRITLHKEKNFLINGYQERRNLMEKFNVEILCEINFSKELSQLCPGDFLDSYILKKKGIEYFFLGHDFSFGKDKKGNREFLEKYCSEKNISVKVLDEFRPKEKISSSQIRILLKDGCVKKANEFLDREFFLKGIVARGSAIGKEIGFPTANLDFKEDLLIPASSVYATKVLFEEKLYLSVTNIGYNPTIQDSKKLSVETHILDFKKDIYGAEIKIFFIDKIREERKFLSYSGLKEQIAQDVIIRRNGDF